MTGQEKTVEEIADIITEAIFSESIVDKKQVRLKILVLIKSFVKIQNSPSRAIFDASPVKEGERAALTKIILTEKMEKQYWKDALRDVIGEVKMKQHYEKKDLSLLKEKFRTT